MATSNVARMNLDERISGAVGNKNTAQQRQPPVNPNKGTTTAVAQTTISVPLTEVPNLQQYRRALLEKQEIVANIETRENADGSDYLLVKYTDGSHKAFKQTANQKTVNNIKESVNRVKKNSRTSKASPKKRAKLQTNRNLPEPTAKSAIRQQLNQNRVVSQSTSGVTTNSLQSMLLSTSQGVLTANNTALTTAQQQHVVLVNDQGLIRQAQTLPLTNAVTPVQRQILLNNATSASGASIQQTISAASFQHNSLPPSIQALLAKSPQSQTVLQQPLVQQTAQTTSGKKVLPWQTQ